MSYVCDLQKNDHFFHATARCNAMQSFEVTMSRAGGGSGIFKVIVHAATPDMARRTAEHQHPGYAAQAVKAVR